MQASLKVTFYDEENDRQYELNIETRSDESIEIFASKSEKLNGASKNLGYFVPGIAEAFTMTFSKKRLDEIKERSALYQPTFSGYISLAENYGPDWAGLFHRCL